MVEHSRADAKAWTLLPEQAFTRCDSNTLPGDSTADLEDLPGLIGQERAIDAVAFGIGLRRPGYNLFALGVSGTGKHTVIADYLRREAARQPTPDDWCYVNNFIDPQRPKALRLPAGRAGSLRDAMRKLVEELTAALPARRRWRRGSRRGCTAYSFEDEIF